MSFEYTIMSMDAHEVFEEVVDNQIGICRRCFKSVEPTGDMGRGSVCGKSCSRINTTLEEEPIKRSKIEGRAPRLLSLIQQEGHTIDEEVFTESINLLDDINEPPRSIFIDAIRAGRGDISITELMNEHGLESKVAQRTKNLVRILPASDVSEELKHIDDSVASEITTVTNSPFPGSNIYYIPNVEDIPEKYRPVMALNQNPRGIMQVIVRENESYFWNSSPKNVDDWLSKLDDEFQECTAEVLYQRIRSNQRFTTGGSPSVNEQFRRTSLWPILQEDKKKIMGFLRRSDNPQSLAKIAKQVDLSQSTVRTILLVHRNTTTADNDSSTELWRPK